MVVSVKEKFLKYIYILPIAIPVLLLIRSCFIASSKNFFSFDELISYYLITDNSFFHMLKALIDGVDNSPPLYFMSAWFWVKLFGSTALSIRMFSCMGFCTAGLITYIILYRAYKFWPAFIGTITVFIGSDLIYRYNYEARFYGFLMAISALAIFLYYKVCTTTTVSKKILILTALTHAAMVLTHYYGFIYSLMIFLAIFIRDKYLGFSRKKIYLSIILGWLLSIPWAFGFIKHLSIMKEDFWLPPPSYSDLLNVYNFEIKNLMFIFIGIFVVLFMSAWKEYKQVSVVRPLYETDQNQKIAKISISLLVYALLAVPALSWLFSRIARPLFIDRYFIPTGIAYAFIIATPLFLSLKQLSCSNSTRSIFAIAKNITLFAVSAILLFSPLVVTKRGPAVKHCLYGLNAKIYEYAKLPIVSAGHFSNTTRFLPCLFYAKDPCRYIYLLDDEVSSKSSSLYMDKEMAALGRNYLPDNVMSTEQFLSLNSSFLVLNSSDWFRDRIKNNHTYIYKTIVNEKLILVQKK